MDRNGPTMEGVYRREEAYRIERVRAHFDVMRERWRTSDFPDAKIAERLARLDEREAQAIRNGFDPRLEAQGNGDTEGER